MCNQAVKCICRQCKTNTRHIVLDLKEEIAEWQDYQMIMWKDMWGLNQETTSLRSSLIGNLTRSAKNVLSARINLTSLKENIIAENVDCKIKPFLIIFIGLCVRHAVAITGMYQGMQIKRCVHVIIATKIGWLTKLHLTISIKPQYSRLTLDTMLWQWENSDKK